jgi:hypothetical protein
VSSNERPDPLLAALGSLQSAEPSAARAERTRARCHQALARRRDRRTQPRLDLRLVWVMCAVYIGNMLWTALTFYR